MRKTIKHKGRLIDSQDVYTIKTYSELTGIPASSLKYGMLSGKIDKVEFNGIDLIVKMEEHFNGK